MTLTFAARVWLPACGLLVAVGVASPANGQATVVNPLPAKPQSTFFHLAEGGGVLPMALYDRLEVVDAALGQPTGQTFAQRMPYYGFLPDPANALPVGFTSVPLEFLGGLKALSLNCAACHVSELHVTGTSGLTRLRIVGGPNMVDFRQFSLDVQASLLRLIANPAQLLLLLVREDRLQPETVAWLERQRLIPSGPRADDTAGPEAAAFLAAMEEVVTALRRQPASPFAGDEPMVRLLSDATANNANSYAAVGDVYRNLKLLIEELQYFLAQGRFPLSTREGYGRLDAFATVRYLLFTQQSAEFPFTAPAGIPHLWGIGRKKWLHWNNNTNSTLQRNIAQALGTGALQTSNGVNNVLFPNLASLETIAQQIAPPRWPSAILSALDPDRVATGRTLYLARCAACHDAGTVEPATGLVEYRLFSLSEIGTDPNHALNFHRPVGSRPFATSLGEQLSKIETWTYKRSNPKKPVPSATQVAWSGGRSRLPAVWRDPLATNLQAPVYAALPLTGVWATAPYLHNASVPTLRDLLRPAAERPTILMVGHREFDPVNVGYRQPANPDNIPARYRFRTTDAGNSNAGHEGPAFGTEGLTDEEIAALLEYLKSL